MVNKPEIWSSAELTHAWHWHFRDVAITNLALVRQLYMDSRDRRTMISNWPVYKESGAFLPAKYLKLINVSETARISCVLAETTIYFDLLARPTISKAESPLGEKSRAKRYSIMKI